MEHAVQLIHGRHSNESNDYMVGQLKGPPLSVVIDKGGFLMVNFDGIKNILLEYEEIILSKIEKKKGIDFSGRYVDGAIRYNDELIHYETIKKRQFRKIMNEYNKINYNKDRKKIIDYGSGKGYMLFLFAQMEGFDAITGIEILPELCEICRNNMKAVGYPEISVINEDARIYTEIDDYNVIFMFNPFPREAMYDVVKRIDESLQRNQREICIIYVNNIHDDLIINGICNMEKKCELYDLPRYGCTSAIYKNK